MNGRVYDYNVGRFMSVDPIVHSGSQGLNPYSYMMNNPLAGTDPTGYKPEKEHIKVKVKTEKVALTGSRIKTHTKTTVSTSKTSASGLTSRTTTSSLSNGTSAGNSTVVVKATATVDKGSQQEVAQQDATPGSTATAPPMVGGPGILGLAGVAVPIVAPAPGVSDGGSSSFKSEANNAIALGLEAALSSMVDSIEESISMQTTMLRRPSTKKLRKIMAEAGVTVPVVGWDIHHIVFWGANKADALAAQEVLKDAGIDINSIENLVAIPRNNLFKKIYNVPHLTHQNDRLHTNDGMRAVLQRLLISDDPRAGLASLKAQIQSGIPLAPK